MFVKIPERKKEQNTRQDDMGKRGGGGFGNKRSAQKLSSSNGFHNPISLKEEITGKKKTKGGNSINSKSMLKLEHLQKLATWASREATIPSLGTTNKVAGDFSPHSSTYSLSFSQTDPQIYTVRDLSVLQIFVLISGEGEWRPLMFLFFL